ncbi:16S rRNA (cytosine(1402)-N(4))-methyltransferase [Salipaludibacillus keqinensis]|uniref:16S rRNA (Cytosine(1402)-N(4))-methyltransferase n=1 Tax=Salipaludibacillus keqinensis TaxID=2045207 RepID=A0A323TWA1_9BACI|nr:class I SAM-dependent methyltransferase [Salipaludibacillus keqinensis]PYZ93825.1 16S rRNA (cytosine(1402)-N(4))-methyltransferase [Salipaludibacillus keqinensis]
MNLAGVLPFARETLQKAVPLNGVAVDATAGNGHDTAFLAKLVGSKGTVYSFDIQEQAINATKDRLKQEQLEERVTLIQEGHETLSDHLLPDHQGHIDGAIFNLGYLPGSDKSVVTSSATTIEAIKQLLIHLKPKGIIVLVVYYGHEEGKIEKENLLPFVQSLPQHEFHVLEYRFTNQHNDPPFIIAIEKRKP